jgi:hypothetical protein
MNYKITRYCTQDLDTIGKVENGIFCIDCNNRVHFIKLIN